MEEVKQKVKELLEKHKDKEIIYLPNEKAFYNHIDFCESAFGDVWFKEEEKDNKIYVKVVDNRNIEKES